jgi:acetaldehyde dehydrogenase (acetylating)
LNPKIVGKPATQIAEWAGIQVPPHTRCLIAEINGVGRDFPLSLEKLSPILTYYVVNGLEEGTRLCDEILHYGGMGHTSSIHSRNREAILQYGLLMPTARVVVNSPSTHGAIGYSTALAPSMTLGCGSWGGNVTSDNISPLHLMDIKRVAFETRAVTSPGNTATPQIQAAAAPTLPSSLSAPLPPGPAPQPDRAAIASLVEQFFAARRPQVTSGTINAGPRAEVVPPPAAEPEKPSAPPPAPAVQAEPPKPATNGHKPVSFVCEDDVKRALAKGEKIYITAKTIITPSARDIGEPHEVFAKV